ncbi:MULTISPECIES: class I SAM-dependent methyltransferase [unclassified Lysobacter]|uniref:class I SAM-dependent methyltransferase n=1 Tax=unclassified Lysobacter TaxID=2635362 RepID=UPI0009EC35AC|nr:MULTISPECIES: class I SAM-dependent methyltransferase [unclassified Lysobacter]
MGKTMSDLKSSVEVVGEPWKESQYYADAERWTFMFWNSDHLFRPYFDRLDLDNVVELACGHGRHSEMVAPMARQLTLMDIHEENLEVCRRRMERFEGVQVIRNNGYDFQPLEAESATAIFCYDAMVHFSPDLVASYLRDSARILKSGGMALFHHSNYDADPSQHYGMNPHARNKMTMETFHRYAAEAGLEVVQSTTLDWGDARDLDGLTLVRKL